MSDLTGPEKARAALGAKTALARSVACPWCKADAWAACTTPSGRLLTGAVHPARTVAWNASKESS